MKNHYTKTNTGSALASARGHIIVLITFFSFFLSAAHAQTFRSAASGSSPDTTSSLTVNKPTGTIAGDVMIAAIGTRPYNVTINTVPTGWTLFQTYRNSTGSAQGGGDNLQALYWKVAGSSEPSSYTWTFSRTEGSVGGILSFFNADLNNPIDKDSFQIGGPDVAFAAPNINTTYSNEMLVTVFVFGSSATWTTPLGMTKTVDIASHVVPYVLGESMCINYGVQAVPGPTGVIRDTASNDPDVGVSSIVALIPGTRIRYSAPSYCQNTGNQSVTLIGMAGGTYSASSPNLWIQSSNGFIKPGNSQPGTYTVTYTYANQGKNYTATTVVTIDPLPVAGTVGGGGSVCTGSNGTLTLTGYTGNVVRWESSTDGGATWATIANTTTSQSYTNITQTTQYRVVVQSGSCGTVTSSAAIVTVIPPSKAGTPTGSTTVCTGLNSGSVGITGQTGNVTKWESSIDNGVTWTAIINTTTSNAYLNLTKTTQYRAIVKNASCTPDTSLPAIITVSPASVGGTVTANATVCSGSNGGTLNLTGQTGSVVRWEFSTNGGLTWSSIVNTTTSYSYSNITQNTQFRAVVQSGACSVANSSIATITVTPAAVGGTVNTSASFCATGTGSLTLTGATGTVTGWESSINGGSTWTSIVNTTSIQAYTNLSKTTDYRALVQNGSCPTATSSPATITISPASVGGTVSSAATVCSGTNSNTLNLSGQTGNVVRWEFSTNAGSTWATIANTTTSYTYTNITQTTMFRAVVQSGVCASANSSAVTITVSPLSVGGTVNTSTAFCTTGSGTLTLTGFTGTVTNWESSIDAGATWTSINNTTTSLNFTKTTKTTQFRAVVQSGVCAAATSVPAIITISPPSVGGTVSSNATVCSGANTGTLNLAGQTGNVVQWESSTDGGTTWTQIVNTATSFSYSNITQTTIFRAVVQSGACATANSSSATITVTPASVGGTVNSSASFCTTGSGTLTLTGQTGSVLRWEFSINGGSTWTTIANTTSTLNYSNVTQTTQYHAIVSNGGCTAATSTPATITISSNTNAGTVNTSATVCFGTGGSLTLTGQSGIVTGWQSSTNSGGTWTAITNVTTSLTYSNISQTTQYRAVVQNGVCPAANSVPATITVTPLPTATIGGSVTVCQNAAQPNITFTGNLGTAPYTFTYNINGGPTLTKATTSGNSVTVAQPTTTAGTFTYNLLSVSSAASCSQAQSGSATITVTAPVATPSFAAGTTSTRCQSAATITYTATAANSTSISYSLDAASILGGNSIVSSTGAVTFAVSWTGTTTITATAVGCNGPATASHTVTTGVAPSASFTYTANPYCTRGPDASISFSGTSGGKFSSSAGLSIDSLTAFVSIQASTPGTYTVNYTIPATASCPTYVSSASLIINIHAIWNGSVSRNWHDANNWSCGGVPTLTSDALIPSGMPRYPIIYSGTGTTHNLKIETGATIIDSGALTVTGVITNIDKGSINALAGKVEFASNSAQVILSNLFLQNTMQDLVISDVAGITLSGPLRITGLVAFGNVNNTVLNTGDSLTLASVPSRDAMVRDVTNAGANIGNTINGLVTVERYIPAKRAYRFLTAPVNSTTTMMYNWMENTINPDRYTFLNPHPGYGTEITGSGDAANGFDATQTHNSSVFTFNNQTQLWSPILNTSNKFTVGDPYRIIIRGDRTVNMNSNTPPPTPTTIRTTGTLKIGSITYSKIGTTATGVLGILSSTPGAYNLIANPYASAVDWLTLTKTNIASTVYVFDPTQSGSGGRGAYVYFNSQTGTNNLTSVVDNILQSGQAFLVQTNGLNPSITFKETDKTNATRAVFRSTNATPNVCVQLQLTSQQGTSDVADAAKVFFSDDYKMGLGDEDSYKFTNQDENLSIMSNGASLSIEGRKPVAGKDSLQLKVWQLTQKEYLLKVNFNNFSYNGEAYLKDKYLSTSVQLNTNGETIVPVTITSNAASLATDRYRIVFEPFATLPLHLLGVKAVEKNSGIEVGWTAESETNMDRYEVEKSTDGSQFVTAGTVKAKADPGLSSNYTWFDLVPFSGDNYYRIKSIDKSGIIKYSNVVRVRITKGTSSITVVPNPVVGATFTVHFTDIKKGNYSVSLINMGGEKMYLGVINHSAGSANHLIQLKSALPAGVYQLVVSDGNDFERISIIAQ